MDSNYVFLDDNDTYSPIEGATLVRDMGNGVIRAYNLRKLASYPEFWNLLDEVEIPAEDAVKNLDQFAEDCGYHTYKTAVPYPEGSGYRGCSEVDLVKHTVKG